MRSRIVEELLNACDRFCVDQQAEHASRGSLQRPRLCRQPANELIGNGFLNDDPLGRHADLPLIHEGAKGGRIHGLLEIGVIEHHQRRLASQLEQHRFNRAPRRRR